MKTIIAGGRDFTDTSVMQECLLSLRWDITEVVSGTAKGADITGEKWAFKHGCPVVKFPAEWNPFPDKSVVDRGAGFKRNAEMADYSEALVAFWDGSSKGTKHMIDTAAKKGLYVKVFLLHKGEHLTNGRTERHIITS